MKAVLFALDPNFYDLKFPRFDFFVTVMVFPVCAGMFIDKMICLYQKIHEK